MRILRKHEVRTLDPYATDTNFATHFLWRALRNARQRKYRNHVVVITTWFRDGGFKLRWV